MKPNSIFSLQINITIIFTLLICTFFFSAPSCAQFVAHSLFDRAGSSTKEAKCAECRTGFVNRRVNKSVRPILDFIDVQIRNYDFSSIDQYTGMSSFASVLVETPDINGVEGFLVQGFVSSENEFKTVLHGIMTCDGHVYRSSQITVRLRDHNAKNGYREFHPLKYKIHQPINFRQSNGIRERDERDCVVVEDYDDIAILTFGGDYAVLVRDEIGYSDQLLEGPGGGLVVVPGRDSRGRIVIPELEDSLETLSAVYGEFRGSSAKLGWFSDFGPGNSQMAMAAVSLNSKLQPAGLRLIYRCGPQGIEKSSIYVLIHNCSNSEPQGTTVATSGAPIMALGDNGRLIVVALNTSDGGNSEREVVFGSRLPSGFAAVNFAVRLGSVSGSEFQTYNFPDYP